MAIKAAIDGGASRRDVWDEHFPAMMRYWRSAEQYRLMVKGERDHKTKVFVCYGPPGTGKSFWAQKTFPNGYWKQRGEWWCAYEHDNVVMDDFYGWIPWDTLLRLGDRYPMMVQTKGSQVQFFAQNLCITSNALPEEWYNYRRLGVDFGALVRRVHQWMYFKEAGEEPQVFESDSDAIHDKWSSYRNFLTAVRADHVPQAQVPTFNPGQ